jgi:O-antigen/teichoic acid export membrane protein
VAVWFAWKNYGPISLAFGSLSSTAINALVATRFRPKHFPWLPGIKEIKRVFAFGSKLTGSTFVLDISIGAPELVLGKLQDISAAGFYSRANGLVQMFYRLFVDAVGAVCLPWFAAKQREDGRVAAPFIKATSYITAFGWSFCLALVFLAHPIVLIMYGDQWGQSVDLTRLLAVAMVFTVPTSLCSTMLLSVGAVNTIVRMTVLSAIVNVSFVALGASHGLVSFGFAMIASAAVMAWLWLRAACKQLELPMWTLLFSFGQSTIVALLAAIGPALSMWIYGVHPAKPLMPLLMGGIGAVLGFVLGVVAAKHPLREEGRMLWLKHK